MAAHRWTVDRPVRDDAENVFVPADELAGAEIDDVVEFAAEGATRTGRIRARLEDPTRGRFFTVELDRRPT